jgi:hypothetical protein
VTRNGYNWAPKPPRMWQMEAARHRRADRAPRHPVEETDRMVKEFEGILTRAAERKKQE